MSAGSGEPVTRARIRSALLRATLAPGWVVLLLAAAAFAGGTSLSPATQYVPLLASVVSLGLPHGAADLCTVAWLRRRPLRFWPGLRLGLLYLAVAAPVVVLWWVAPLAALMFFIALTWFHWGQGDLFATVGLLGARHLQTRGQRALAVAVRGGAPMLVPLLAFPGVYLAGAADLVSLFDPAAAAWLNTRGGSVPLRVAGALYGTLVLLHLALGARRAPADDPGWQTDLGETLLLIAFFALVPPVFAIGLYFCFWHSIRHIARLLPWDPPARRALHRRRPGRALLRYATVAAPLTGAALLLLGGLYRLVPRSPDDVASAVALYLVLISALTLPHVCVVTWMDRRQHTWHPDR